MSDLRKLTGRTHFRDTLTSLFHITKALIQLLLVFGTLGGTVIGLLVVQELMRIPDLSFLKDYKPVDAISIY
ncbi:MAG TPA: hypothetical protein PLY72_19975, partial [Candidatus Obscuribacter sp.]|nr:hypothetical protein [Candidatus Obscuribacter sp.]